MVLKENILDIIDDNFSRNQILGLIQHGSSVSSKLINPTSDYDYLVVFSDDDSLKLTSDNSSIITIRNKKKIHINFVTENQFDDLLLGIETEILTSILDLNILSTRLLSGLILIDNGDIEEKIINSLSKSQINNLVKKFVYQSFNFIKDLQGVKNMYSEQKIMENVLDSLVAALLIKNQCFLLNVKHQPILVEEYLKKDAYVKYLKVRFNYQKYRDLRDSIIKELLIAVEE